MIQTNKFSSAIENFIAFVVTPSENYGILCHFGGYDKGFYGSCLFRLNFYLYEKQLIIILNPFNLIDLYFFIKMFSVLN